MGVGHVCLLALICGFISCCASARLGEPADGYSEESAADHADEMNPMSSDDPHGSFQDEYEEEMDAPYSEDEKVLDAEERETAHKWVTAVFESYKAELANKREEQTAADIVQRVCDMYEPKFDDPKFGAEAQYAVAMLRLVLVRTDEKQHTAHAKAATKLLNLALQQGVKEAQMVLAYWHMRKANEEESHCEAAASFYQNVAGLAIQQKDGDSDTEPYEEYLVDLAAHGKKTEDTRAELEEENAYADLHQAGFGRADAQRQAGLRHLLGKGLDKDVMQAQELLQQAAEQGDAYATFNLGYMHYSGLDNVTQNFSEALKYFEIAADQDITPAINAIGLMYLNGNGVSVNTTKALEMLHEAARLDDPDATFNLAQLYLYGVNNVPRNYTAGVKYALAAKRMRFWKADYLLGQVYLFGMGEPRDCAKGVSHLKQIADSWADAHEIALLAEDAFLGKNYSESAIRYFEAAELGSARAQINLAYLARYHPESVAAFPFANASHMAIAYLEAAVTQQSDYAMMELGDWHYYGRDPLPKNLSAAHRLYARAAALNSSVEASFVMGTFAHFAIGQERDVASARAHYNKSLEIAEHLLPDALPAHLAIALLDLEEVITRTVYCMGEWARLRSCQYSALDAIRPTAAAVAL